MRFGLVLGLRLAAPDALFDSRDDDALRKVGQVDWCADSALEDWQILGREYAHSLPMRFERIRQWPHDWYRYGRVNGFWFVDDGIPDGTLNGQRFPAEVSPTHAANFSLSQSGERRE